MAWPTIGTGSGAPEITATGVIASGDATYMRWGTKDLVTAPVGYYVITRAAQRPKKEDLQYDNGDGIQSGRVQLIHGVVWDVTVRDDRRMTTPPRVGQTVTVVDMAGICGTKVVGAAYVAYVLDANYDAAPKQPGERVVVLERITLIEGA